MGDLFFVVKTFIFTVIVVLLMQLKVGGKTIESQALAIIQNSAVTENLRLVAAGAVMAAQKGYDTVSAVVKGEENAGAKRRTSRSADEFE